MYIHVQFVLLNVSVWYAKRTAVSCTQCTLYWKTLQSCYINYSTSSSSSIRSSSHANVRYDTTPRRTSRVKLRKIQVKNQKRKILSLEKKIENLIKQQGIGVDEELHSELFSMIQSESAFPEGSLKGCSGSSNCK